MSALLNRAQRWWLRRGLAVYHSPSYRLPIPRSDGAAGLEPRRADFACWYLLDRQVLSPAAFHGPRRVRWSELLRVHSPEWLEALTHAETLGGVYALAPSEVSVDGLLHTVRAACGGTLAAARRTLRTHQPALNLLGGFHHAARNHGGGFCAVNDVAVAVAVLRAEDGFAGRVVVLDLDAHPPDGTADCLEADPSRWMGSLSGSAVPLPAWVDETVLPAGTKDGAYLQALDGLLARMPRADLAFVLAGGDVLAGDRLGNLALTLDGLRRRDLKVRAALKGTPSVWLAAGGYSQDAWRALAGTALALELETRRPISPRYDPLAARFRAVAQGLLREELGLDEQAENELIEVELGIRRAPARKMFLGYYTAQGIELAFSRYGMLGLLERLGYSDVHVAVDAVDQGDRMRVLGTHAGREHVLVEVVEQRGRVAERDVLYVHWLNLRHPAAAFSERRPRLPGQDVPGLGLSREAGEFLDATARRLGLAGVAFRPGWFHTAYAARHRYRFVDDARQGRFLALVRDLSHLPLLEATQAVAEGRVMLDGAPYAWEADVMVHWLDGPVEAAAPALPQVARASRFTLRQG